MTQQMYKETDSAMLQSRLAGLGSINNGVAAGSEWNKAFNLAADPEVNTEFSGPSGPTGMA